MEHLQHSVGSRAIVKGPLGSRRSSRGKALAGRTVLLVGFATAVLLFVYTNSTAALRRNSTPFQKTALNPMSVAARPSAVDGGFAKVNCNPFDEEGIACCGHRGAPMVLPENTVPGFLEAFREGATCVEMDVRLTSDSLFAVGHTRVLNELLIRNRQQYDPGPNSTRILAENMSLSDLKKIKLGPLRPDLDCPACKVPALEEVLQVIWRKPVQLVLELKVDGGENPRPEAGDQLKRAREYLDSLMDFLEKLWSTKLQENRLTPPQFLIVLISFDRELIDMLGVAIAKASPSLLTNIRGYGYVIQPKASHDMTSFGRNTNVVALHTSRISETISLWHNKRYTLSWVVDQLPLMKSQVREGVNAIITNDPSLCKVICKS